MKRLDAYYTPTSIASAVAHAVPDRPRAVLDPSCGDGQLLRAIAARFPRAAVFGVDKSAAVVRHLTSKEPSWVLSVGDATRPSSLSRTRVVQRMSVCDLLVMNPPFTMGAEKGVEFRLGTTHVRSSRAMQHLALSCFQFWPNVALAVLPESSLFSDLDGPVRAMIEREYDCEPIGRNCSSAFVGARVRTRVVKFSRRLSLQDESSPKAPQTVTKAGRVSLVRGTLQMFRAESGRTPLLHTTDLGSLADADGEPRFGRFVRRLESGCVRGFVALIPRVGSPPVAYRPRVVYCPRDVQLSDCLIGVVFDSRRLGQRFVSQLVAQWDLFLREVFVGTGAPYVTMDRLRAWIEQNTSFSCA